jgi:hypothetical protein
LIQLCRVKFFTTVTPDAENKQGNKMIKTGKLNIDLNITYANWLTYDGYINVYQTSVDFVNIISQGDIGAN